MQNVVIWQNWPVKGLCGRCFTAYLSEAPFPSRCLFGGGQAIFVGSESGQMKSVKLLAEYGFQQNPHTPPPPPPLTQCIRKYSIHYLFTQGREEGGRVEPERRGNRREYRSQSRVENTNMTKCTQEISIISINSNKHLPQSPFHANFFNWQHFALISMSLIFPRKIW